MTTDIHSILLKHFGYTQFRAGQIDIISSIVSQKNTLAILPTGGGKSLCFQIPALAFTGTTIVISPLIALMKDQVDALQKRNIPATYLNSSLEKKELSHRLQIIANNQYKLVYLAPERLISPSFLLACKSIHIPFVAVDEAHCASLWGHDFRPSYKNIAQFVQVVSNYQQKPAIAAFTATATDLVQSDILDMLAIQDAAVFKKSFRRDNLCLSTYNPQSTDHKMFLLLRILQKHLGEAGILYVSTRSAAETLTAQLKKHDFSNSLRIAFYHGGMDSNERSLVQELFLSNKLDCIVSTNAFGMGVDKSNIRFVVHYHLSAHIENYYQEAGRAGRDGKMSHCYLLFSERDIDIHLGLLQKTNPDTDSIRYKNELQKLKKMVWLCKTKKCKTQFILNYFNEKTTEPCKTMCSSCDPLISILLLEKEKKQAELLFNHIKKHAKNKKTPISQILTKKITAYIVLLKPRSKQDFLKIPGIGHGWVEEWYGTMQRYEKRSHDHRTASSRIPGD